MKLNSCLFSDVLKGLFFRLVYASQVSVNLRGLLNVLCPKGTMQCFQFSFLLEVSVSCNAMSKCIQLNFLFHQGSIFCLTL